MKIAIIRSDIRDICSNNYNNQEIGLSKELEKLGHQIDIITPWTERKNVSLTKNINVLFRPNFKIPVLNHIFIKDIGQIIQDGSYDILHCNEENISSTLYYYLRRKKSRFVIYHGMYKVLDSKVLKIYERLHNLIAPKIMKRSIVFTKTREAFKFIEFKNYKSVEVLPIGLDVENLKIERNSEPEPNKSVLYVGVLEERRNIKFIVKLAEQMPDYNFTIIGTGPEEEVINNALKRKNINNIEFIPKVSQDKIHSYYKGSNILILPSNFEIFGMVLLEALYYDLPILSTPTAGAVDIVDKRAGRICNLEVDQWVKEIEFICSNRELYSPREVYLENYQWQTIAEKYHKRVCED